MWYRDFVIAGNEELVVQSLEAALISKYKNMSKTRIKEAIKEIDICILDGFNKHEDTDQELEQFEYRYADYKHDELNEAYIGIFEEIEKKGLVHFRFGRIGENYKWIWEMEIDADDIDFHMLKRFYD